MAGFSPSRFGEGPGERLTSHEWDPKRWRTLSQRGWAKGVQGAEPPGKGLWGVSPHKTKRGSELPALATQPRVGPKTLANSKPTGVGKGSPGARPYAKPYGEITTKVPGLSGEEYTKPAPTGRAGSVQ